MFIDIKSDNYNIHFEFERRVTVIKGDSGIGKTTLVELLQEESYDIVKNTSLPVVIAAVTTWKIAIQNSKSAIIIFDDLDCVETAEFSSLYHDYAIKNDLYFIIIGRADTITQKTSMARLSYSINSIYTIESDGNQYRQKLYYDLPEYSGKCDAVLVEDTTSGYTFFEKLFEGFATVKCSQFGKSSIVQDVLQWKTGKLLVIFDGAAFGCHVNEFYDLIVLNRDVVILNNYECFEELLIQSNMFNKNEIVRHGISELPISANKYLSWELYFEELIKDATYSKQYKYSHGSVLLHCFWENCKECNEFIYKKCDYFDKECKDKFISLLENTKYNVLIMHRKYLNNDLNRIDVFS